MNLKKGGIMNNMIKKTEHRPASVGSVVDELFQTNFNRMLDDRFWGFNGLASDSRVPVNIHETATTFEIAVVAPSLRKEDFQLSYTGENLTVSFAKAADNHTNSGCKWIRREYHTNSFSRSFTLDDSVDTDKATALYEAGVLHITLPKKEEAKPVSRKIDVQ